MPGRREPNVGPGSAQIIRVSAFVNSKTDGENAIVLSWFSCDLQKKKSLHGRIPLFCTDCYVISKKKSSKKNAAVFSGFWCDLQKKKKKVFGLLHTDFSLSFRWALCRAPWIQQAPKSMGPGAISPLTPSRRPWKDAELPGRMTRRWASPTCSMPRRNTASIMKNLIYHIPVVFFQFIILILLTGGAEFPCGKKAPTILLNWKLTACLFSSWLVCSRICRFVRSAWLFSSAFTRSKNMSNYKSVENAWPQKLFQQEQFFFFNALLFFSARLLLVW